MVYLVFNGLIIANGIAPVMLCDEFAKRPLFGQVGLLCRGCRYGAERRAGTPRVFQQELSLSYLQLVRHGDTRIILPVSKPCNGSDSDLRDQFSDEHDTAARPPADIKSQIHFFKGLVKRYCAPEQARLVELKSDEARINETFVGVEFSARGNKWPKQVGLDRIVQH